MFNHILVVCVGNICRSPMGEGLLRARAPDGVSVSSAGIGALVGYSADPTALKLMQAHGMDITHHRARQLTPELVLDADLILVMEQEHVQHVHSISPASRGKVHIMGKWGEIEVPDPYRKSPEYFEHVFALIKQGVDQWSSRLWC